MRHTKTLVVVGLCALLGATALRPCHPRALGVEEATMAVTETTTFAEVIVQLSRFTPAKIRMSNRDIELARQYAFPPLLIGQSISLTPVAEALNDLLGAGWEGSPIAIADRARAGDQYQISRMPYAFDDGSKKHWTCNNRQWGWDWKKTKGDPAGGVLRIYSRLQSDGDVVKGKPFGLSDLKEEDALSMLLDLMKLKTQCVVNVIPYDSQFIPVASPPTTEAPANKPEVRRLPMTVSAIPSALRQRLATGVTPGEFLSIITIALNQFTRPAQTDWRWSSTVDATGKITYTLRDYAHLETNPPNPRKHPNSPESAGGGTTTPAK